MMKDRSRVSQQELMDVIASAVETEGRRIEQITAVAAEQVGGGGDPNGTTMGYFPPKVPDLYEAS